MDKDEIAALEQGLQIQMDKLNEAITKIRRNELVDIGYMEQDVSELCAKILQSDEDASKILEPKMITLITVLDELAVELQEYQNRINPDGNA